jgi:hypothetical protein
MVGRQISEKGVGEVGGVKSGFALMGGVGITLQDLVLDDVEEGAARPLLQPTLPAWVSR